MKKHVKWIGGVGVSAGLALQLSNPSLRNPSFVPASDLLTSQPPPPAIAATLKNCCYDCHSFQTKWPWYSHIAPVSWFVVRDVEAARGSLNFSEWPTDDPKRARKRWRHIAEEVQDGDMPLTNYVRMHREATLDPEARAELVQWALEQAGD